MSDFAVRLLDESEFRPAMDLFRRAMHDPPVTDELWRYESAVYRDGRAFGAFADRSMIGTTLSFPSAVTVPGGRRLPMAAVTFVGVRTDHRRRGVLSELMATQLTSAAQAGEVFAGLRASEGSIYGRFGYGIASTARFITVSTRRAEFRPEVPRGGVVRLLDADEAVSVLPTVYERIAGNRPGSIVRPACWWTMSVERRLRVEGHMLAAVHTGPDGDDGFVTYLSGELAWETLDGGATLRVYDLHGGTPAAVNDLWRFVLGVDLVDKVTAFIRPLDEPLEAMLVNQHVLRSELDDELWLRLVDVPAALAARSYADVAPVVLEVQDRLLPANSGRYRVGPEGAERTTDEADLVLPVDALAMIYLGGTRPSNLAAVGRVQARDPEPLRRADQLFAIEVPPWCGTMF